MKRVRPSDVRAQLGLTQTQLAELAGITQKVVSRGETGGAITRLSAFAMLNVLNQKRQEKNLPPLEIDEMDWKIRGER